MSKAAREQSFRRGRALWMEPLPPLLDLTRLMGDASPARRSLADSLDNPDQTEYQINTVQSSDRTDVNRVDPAPNNGREITGIIGLFDDPANQCQPLFSINLLYSGHILVCGISMSGKSSLIRGELAARFPEAIVIDQKPIGVSSRSTPATYSGIGDMIRKKFAEENGVGVEWFSFNSKGACPVCGGRGVIRPEIAFADPVEIVCEECRGKRFNPIALSYHYQGKNIDEVTSLTVNQAVEFFDDPKISRKLKGLRDVGLGYMTLGQSTSSMSGGENQRLKLASGLNNKGNIYILDEPSTGLHYKDIEHLMGLLRKMADRGNTIIMIEHRLEMIAAADWIIEMGPLGGSEGGRVVFSGVPENLIKEKDSLTGKYIRMNL